MAVKIRLKRIGKVRHPFYRVVVVDSRKKRDGRVIEEIGTYNPKTEPSTVHVASERARYWLGVGAQPTEAVAAILKLTGDLPGSTATLRHPEPGADKAARFSAALAELHDVSGSTSKTMSGPKSEQVAPSKASAKDSPAEGNSADEASAEETKADV